MNVCLDCNFRGYVVLYLLADVIAVTIELLLACSVQLCTSCSSGAKELYVFRGLKCSTFSCCSWINHVR